jgi:hypothetical protein
VSRGGRRVAILCRETERLDDPGFVPFNYAARRIQAAVVGDPELADAEVRVFEGGGRSPEELAREVERFDPDVVGASAYLWSFPHLLETCVLLKESRGARTVVFGGPSARPAMFDLEPFREPAESVDAIVTRDGELAFRSIVALRDRTFEALRAVPGVAARHAGGWTTPVPVPEYDLDLIVSPYQLDLAPRGCTAHLETFRGCPLNCSFCEWGVADRASRVLSEEYLVRELEAFRRASANGAFIVDAAPNLNARAFRNLKAAEERVGFFREAPLTCELYPTHIRKDLLEFLASCQVHHVGIGVQSFNEEVLRYVQRPGDARRTIEAVHAVADVVPCFIELIFGLPGDDPDSFFATIDRALELPCNTVVHHCLVLPDGFMTRAPRGADMQFEPHTLRMTTCRGWPPSAMEAAMARLDELAGATDGRFNDYSWRLPPRGGGKRFDTAWVQERDRELHLSSVEQSHQDDDRSETTAFDDLSLACVSHAVGVETGEALQVTAAWREAGQIGVALETPRGPLVIDVKPAGVGDSYRTIAGLAFAYRVPEWGLPGRELLEHVETAMRGIARGLDQCGCRPSSREGADERGRKGSRGEAAALNAPDHQKRSLYSSLIALDLAALFTQLNAI